MNRYSITWTSADRQWHCQWSHPNVADAKAYAREHAPTGATGYRIKRIGGDYVVEGAPN